MTGVRLSFGLVLTPHAGGREWSAQARRAEKQGWSAILVPDTLWTTSPLPALAVAGAVTTTLRLRSWVLAAPLRCPAAVIRETAALQQLSDGRFELGIGAGRPDAEQDAAHIGVPWGSATERIAQVEEVIAAVRAKVEPAPQMVVAAAGPRMLEAAGRCADRIALALPPTATEQDLHAAVDRVRSSAPDTVRISQQLSGLAGRLPAWLIQGGLDPVALAATRAVGMLTGDVSKMAETLLRRGSEFGIDEFIVPGELADEFAPVISALTR